MSILSAFADSGDFLAKALAPEQIGTVRYVSSGTDALYRVLQHCAVAGRTKLYLSAFTCPEVVSAALAAGFVVIPRDVEKGTFRIDIGAGEIDCEHGVLLLSNLYGFPEPLPLEAMDRGLVVVDDACQAGLSKRDDGVRVGFDRRTHGVWSFGRGKALCAFGGGAFRVMEGTDLSAEPIPSAMFTLPVTFAQSILFHVISQPAFYGILTRIPGLHLGETSFRPYVNLSGASAVQLLAARAKSTEIDSDVATYRRHAALWHEVLKEWGAPEIAKLEKGTVPIRYPMLCDSTGMRDYLLRDGYSIGVVRSYPATIPTLCRGFSRVIKQECPNAEQVALRLLTLPTHSGVPERLFHCFSKALPKSSAAG